MLGYILRVVYNIPSFIVCMQLVVTVVLIGYIATTNTLKVETLSRLRSCFLVNDVISATGYHFSSMLPVML